MDIYDIVAEYVDVNCTEISENEYIEIEYIEKN